MTAPELARREAGAALDEALDVLFAALPRVEALAREEERAAERAAVVAWLRECALDPETTGAEMRLFQTYALAIERGVHRREEKE